jgi:hypothetical protein
LVQARLRGGVKPIYGYPNSPLSIQTVWVENLYYYISCKNLKLNQLFDDTTVIIKNKKIKIILYN